jgi:CMP-N-acetylneuraminic acid synthetase
VSETREDPPRVGRPSAVALIPARAGSKRVADKNIRPLAGHPVMAYTISAALTSGVFDAVVVSTDSPDYARIAEHYGAEIPALRPAALAGDLSPDVEWVVHMMRTLAAQGRTFDCFSILRPTSPFRQPATIRRAWDSFLAQDGIDSLRAVEKCRQHPGKMWIVRGQRMHPLLPFGASGQPWHSSQYPALPEVYVQNASLEIAWTRVLEVHGSIAGEVLVPFFTEGFEGFDVNYTEDWSRAEDLISAGLASLPPVATDPFTAVR